MELDNELELEKETIIEFLSEPMISLSICGDEDQDQEKMLENSIDLIAVACLKKNINPDSVAIESLYHNQLSHLRKEEWESFKEIVIYKIFEKMNYMTFDEYLDEYLEDEHLFM